MGSPPETRCGVGGRSLATAARRLGLVRRSLAIAVNNLSLPNHRDFEDSEQRANARPIFLPRTGSLLSRVSARLIITRTSLKLV